MRKIKINTIILSLALSFLALTPCFAQENNYASALAAVKSGDKDTAFMNFYSIVKHDLNSKYREKALFATGEYYFQIADYSDAFQTFINLLEQYPDSEMRPFALFYVFQLAKTLRYDNLAKVIQNKIINSERIILIFSNSKEHKLKSPMGANYRLVHYIDRIEFYINGKMQTQISY